jgi:hypothetical protein
VPWPQIGLQRPPEQVCCAAHWLPQTPQLESSVEESVQVPPQHTSPVWQGWLHPPQLLRSFWVKTQLPEQQV